MSNLLKISAGLLISSIMYTSYAQGSSIEQITLIPLAGTWAMVAKTFVKIKRVNKTTTTEESVSVKCNTCPEIVFSNDGTGCINSENGEKLLSTFTWKVTGGKLLFFNTKSANIEDNILASGPYQITSHQLVAGSIAIELIDSRKSKQLLIKLK